MKTGTLIPALQYKDAPAAIEWLCTVLGYSEHLVIPARPKTIAHAQLTQGDGMIMLNSRNDNDYSQHIRTPKEVNEVNTQSPLLNIEEAEIAAHYAQAVKAGADILQELKSEEYGGQYYSCKNPEGHLWNTSFYNPFAVPTKRA